MDVVKIIFALVYVIAGYWATGWTLYYNKIVIETQPGGLFCKRLAYGIFLGWILIPIAIIRKLIHGKEG